MVYYQSLDNDQRRNLLDNTQLFEAFMSAMSDQRQHRGGMSWQQVNGKDYLVRVIDSRTKKSVGPRSPETESVYDRFLAGKRAAGERLQFTKERLHRQSRVCRALNLGRIPRLTGNILRSLAALSLDRKTTTIIGTNALYAYEAMAGVQFRSDILATNDLDILWDARSRLKIASEIPAEGMIAILKKIDKSFAVMDKAKYRAVNKDGFMVDLLRETVDMRIRPESSFALEDAFIAVESDMKWLISSPKVSVVALDEDGYPAPLSVPDPRAFALHKLWLASKPDRDPVKRPRDAAQAAAIAHLVQELLPQYPISEKALRMFPKTLTGPTLKHEDNQIFMGFGDVEESTPNAINEATDLAPKEIGRKKDAARKSLEHAFHMGGIPHLNGVDGNTTFTTTVLALVKDANANAFALAKEDRGAVAIPISDADRDRLVIGREVTFQVVDGFGSLQGAKHCKVVAPSPANHSQPPENELCQPTKSHSDDADPD